jgi:hypothetical protein
MLVVPSLSGVFLWSALSSDMPLLPDSASCKILFHIFSSSGALAEWL